MSGPNKPRVESLLLLAVTQMKRERRRQKGVTYPTLPRAGKESKRKPNIRFTAKVKLLSKFLVDKTGCIQYSTINTFRK